MKWFKKKNILGFLLVACAVASFYFGNIMPLSAVKAIGIIVVLLLAVLVLVFATKGTGEREMTDQEAEKREYPALKRAAQNLEAVKHTLFLMIVCCIIGFGLTSEYAFIFVLLGSAIPYGILRIAYIVNLFRYK